MDGKRLDRSAAIDRSLERLFINSKFACSEVKEENNEFQISNCTIIQLENGADFLRCKSQDQASEPLSLDNTFILLEGMTAITFYQLLKHLI